MSTSEVCQPKSCCWCSSRFPNRSHAHVGRLKFNLLENNASRVVFPFVLADHCQLSCRISQGEWAVEQQCREYVGKIVGSNLVMHTLLGHYELEVWPCKDAYPKSSTQKQAHARESRKDKNFEHNETKRTPLPF